ncbi:MAG: hypothetical protein ACUVTG_03675 [Candidatus Oleimicrobiaceae bacterium]
MRRDNRSFAFPVGTFLLFIGVLLLSLKGAPHERKWVIGVQLTESQLVDSLLAAVTAQEGKFSIHHGPMGRVFHLAECKKWGPVRLVVVWVPPGSENVAASSVLMAHAAPDGWRPDVVLGMTLCPVVMASPGDILVNTAWAIGHSARYDGHNYTPKDLWTWDPTLGEARPCRYFWSNQGLMGTAVDSYLRLTDALTAQQSYTLASSSRSLPRLHLDRLGVSSELELGQVGMVAAWESALAIENQEGLRLLPGSHDQGLAAAAKVFQESGIPFAGAAMSAPADSLPGTLSLAARFLWTWIGTVAERWGFGD